MKKTLSFLIATVLALTVFSAVAFSDSNVSDNYAEETNLTPTVYEPHAIRRFPDPVELPYSAPEEEYPKYLASKDFAYSAELLNTLEDMLKDALILGTEQVDVSHLQIMPDDLSLYFILTYSPYFNEDIDITPYIHKDGCYSHVKLYNKMSRKETRDHFAKIDEKLSEISDVMSGAKTAFDKVLLLHDYLVYNAEYDYENYLKGTIPEESYRSYGVIMNGTGVCQSYANAYTYLLAREGVECYVVTSDAMNHAWNVVNIDGKYYHVDVTWDDPVPDSLGKVNHNYFLKSDSAFASGSATDKADPHYGWSEDAPKCTSTLYDKAYFNSIKSSIIVSGDSSYYIKDRSIIKRNNKISSESELVSLGKWPTWDGTGTWVGGFSGLTLKDGALYYNTSTEIRKFNLATGEDTVVLAPNVSQGYIFGSAIFGETLKYFTATEPNGTRTIFTVDFDIPEEDRKVTLNRRELLLNEGESFRLTASVITDDLTWTSSNPAIAQVSSDGTVTAVSTGTATITVTAPNGSFALCSVDVRHTHDFSDWEVLSEANCTEGETKRRICNTCHIYETETSEPLGHSLTYFGGMRPGCTTDGWNPYSVCARCNYNTFEIVPATGHVIAELPAVKATCTEGGYTAGSYCTACLLITVSQTPVSATGHAFGEWTVIKESTELETGLKEHTCSTCGHTESAIIPTQGHTHTYSKSVTTKPTCLEGGFTVHYCSCGDTVIDSYTDPTGHVMDVFGILTPSSCTSKGEELHYCQICGYFETVYIPLIPHTEMTVDAKEPSCTTAGYTESVICSVCNTVITPPAEIEAQGHDFAEEWTVDFEPTYTAEGQKSRHCTRCAEVTDVITIAKKVMIIDSSMKFIDLEEKVWSKEGIDYVVSYGYMNGTGNGTTFDQTGTMTRAMIVSVLWRIAEKPSTEIANPFIDLEAEQTWYHEGVIWAYENGIVTGTSKTTFSPTGAVTREQMATFLYRYAGFMGYDVEGTADLSHFPDESKVGTWAHDALAWAVSEGLITGAKGNDGVTKLDPQGAATREQVATILMRFCKTVIE